MATTSATASVTSFEFSTATRVVFGSRIAQTQLVKLAAELGTRAFVVTGKSTRIADELLSSFDGTQTKVRFSHLERHMSPEDWRGAGYVGVGVDDVDVDVDVDANANQVTIEGRFSVAHEPTVEDAREATLKAREARCDLVIAIGGGSPIDLAKVSPNSSSIDWLIERWMAS